MREDSAFEPLGVRVAHLGPDRGFCGVATRDIRADDVLVRVLARACSPREDARACPTVGRACVELGMNFRAIALKLLLEPSRGRGEPMGAVARHPPRPR